MRETLGLLFAGRASRPGAPGRSQWLVSTARTRRPVGGPRHGQARQRLLQPGHVDVPAVERVAHRAVPAPALGHQRQIHRHYHRRVDPKRRVHQLEQLVPARDASSGSASGSRLALTPFAELTDHRDDASAHPVLGPPAHNAWSIRALAAFSWSRMCSTVSPRASDMETTALRLPSLARGSRSRPAAHLPHGRGGQPLTCGSLCDPIPELGSAIRHVHQVDPPQHLARSADQHVEIADPRLLLGQQATVPLVEPGEVVLATIRD